MSKGMTTAPEMAQRAVEELCDHYRAKARAVARVGVATGAAIGLLVGSVPVTPLHFAWPIPTHYVFATILAGISVGALIGYVIGDARAQLYRRMAQQARLQLQLERRISANDVRIAELVAELQARPTTAAVEVEVEPEPPRRLPYIAMVPPLLPPVSG